MRRLALKEAVFWVGDLENRSAEFGYVALAELLRARNIGEEVVLVGDDGTKIKVGWRLEDGQKRLVFEFE